MEKAGEMFINAINHWRENRCVGTALIPHPLNDKVMVLGVLQRIYARSPTSDVLIIVSNFTERMNIIEFLTTQEEEENNKEFKDAIYHKFLKIWTKDFLYNTNGYVPTTLIIYNVYSMDMELRHSLQNAKFKLVILNKLIDDTKVMSEIYANSPLLSDFKQTEIDALRTSLPVEDMWINVDIPEDSEEGKLLKYYNDYIASSIAIFGSFDLMQQARTGNLPLNISATQICLQIAQENGWNDHLDMSVPINIEIDNCYNPNSIRERATMTYDIIRERTKLLSDYKGKLNEILKIVIDNPNSKILIINKRGEFANQVTEYINNHSEFDICGNYHDKVDMIDAIDINGKPLFYKSGPNKGKRRTMGYEAQETLNNKRFEESRIRILSTNNAPNKKLYGQVDIIIITSPLCEPIESYLYRLSNIYVAKNKLNLFTLYVKNSLEQNKLQSQMKSDTHIIVNNCENEVAVINNSDFVIVD